MNILSTQYTIKYKSFDIFLAGCKGNPYCNECCNPESWNFNQGYQYNNDVLRKIKNKIIEFDSLINNFMIFGGEPLDQPYDELIKLLMDLSTFRKAIWLFTRYDLNQIPENIKKICDYIKTGRYIKELQCDDNIHFGIKLASKNQKIIKL